MANPIQQGLKPDNIRGRSGGGSAAMANPIQQGLKPDYAYTQTPIGWGRNG